jgi:alkylation response protein AidB-like acyl-CoA dehydrogenase
MDAQEVQAKVADVARGFASDRKQRQLRRSLAPADFQALADAGFLLTGVPASMGGLWTDVARSTRPIGQILRTLARGDPSVALVSSMHPAVLSIWLSAEEAPEPYGRAWTEQRRFVAQTSLDGDWWGTITSEPGSGGDVSKTRTAANRDGRDGQYTISGQKHFGSGSGIATYMITTAVPEGEERGDWFFLNVRAVPWDGSRGMKLVAEWDGHGMAATQSHAFDFTRFPAVRLAWPDNLLGAAGRAGAFIASQFTSVVVGTVESAVEAARSQVGRNRDSLRPYEGVEWVRIENEAWLINQAYEGMLRAVEAKGSAAILDVLHGKTAIAELAESVTNRICKVVGGGTYSRLSPFGFAFEDVRALGFLRPPWGLAFDQILQQTWKDE